MGNFRLMPVCQWLTLFSMWMLSRIHLRQRRCIYAGVDGERTSRSAKASQTSAILSHAAAKDDAWTKDVEALRSFAEACLFFPASLQKMSMPRQRMSSPAEVPDYTAGL